MTKKLLFVTTLLLVVAFAAMAADVTGKWTYEQAGRQGGNPTVVTLNLKQAGTTLTGNQSRPGRDGAAMETPITEGKVEGDNISFVIEMNMGGNAMKTTYTGTVAGNEIKLKVSRPGRDGGAPTVTEMTAKKAN
jgi:hypothetical protein